MLAALRFLGIVNASVWFGSAIFLTFAAGPAFFSPEMLELMPRYHAGRVAQVVLGRYFVLQAVCAAVAVAHLVLGWLYAGKHPGRSGAGLLTGLVALGLAGGLWLQPKLKELHAVKYATNTTPAQKAEAGKSFGAWHGVSQGMNLLLTAGVLLYLWRTVETPAAPRMDKLRRAGL